MVKASDLPWWAWLLAAAVIGFVAVDGLVGIVGKRVSDSFSFSVALVMFGIATLLAIIGLIRLLKWTWKD